MNKIQEMNTTERVKKLITEMANHEEPTVSFRKEEKEWILLNFQEFKESLFDPGWIKWDDVRYTIKEEM